MPKIVNKRKNPNHDLPCAVLGQLGKLLLHSDSSYLCLTEIFIIYDYHDAGFTIS